MRAVFISENARRGDAIGHQLASKIRTLRAHGSQVQLYLQDDRQLQPDVRDVGTVQTSARLWSEPTLRQQLLDADLIAAEYGSWYDLLNLLPAVAGRGPRILIDYHGVTPKSLWQPADAERLANAESHRDIVWCADLAMVHSTFAADELHQATAFPRERIRILPCSVDTTWCTPGSPSSQVRTRSGLGEARVLLFVGRLAANKRPWLLVEALPHLRDLPRPVHAVFIGDDQDIYAAQADCMRDRARALGLADRVHLLGRLPDVELRDWYRSADVLVIPSLHEGFGLPLVEAMACGLPVVAARSTAIPETLADAGLTFATDDAADLAAKVKQVLAPGPCVALSEKARVAVVAPRFGSDFVGGAERSLRLIARTMQQQGHHAEVFTTCTRQESDWHNELPAGTERAEGLLVHRFPVDEHDRGSFQSALDVIRRQHGQVDTATEQAYLRNSLQSSTLIEALGQRERDFDAIIVGPYLFGLTHEVAAKFRRKVLFVPCFHDEPFARLPTLQATYREVGGLLYHSPEEKWLAEARLGINHPNATVIGTLLDGEAVTPSDIQHSHATPPRRLVYCGRYSVEKGVQLLLEYAERYTSQHPERFRFVFIGHGPLALPKRAWLENLGFVTEHRKRQELSNAAALVQLSTNESLSLVALEAWAQGLPVIGHEKCVVVREQIRRANGGVTIADYAGFAAALDQLWANPERWRQLGENGKRFVDEQYRSADQFASRLRTTIRNLNRPLPDLLREKGLLRAAHFSEPVWERRLAKLLEELMDTPPRSASPELQVLPQAERKHVTAQQHSILIPVRIRNTGGLPVAAEGPGVATVGYELRDEHGKLLHRERSAARLPALLRPDSEQLLVVPINLPQGVGPWSVTFSIFRRTSMSDVRQESKSIEICLHDSTESRIDTPASGFLHAAQQAVHRAQALQELPDDYRDVTQGVLAGWKRRVKEKLLHQFRKSYVDVLSRQQSAFNEQMLIALCQMIDAITTSDQAADAATLGKSFQQQIRRADRRARRRLARIERRLEILEEALVERKESVP